MTHNPPWNWLSGHSLKLDHSSLASFWLARCSSTGLDGGSVGKKKPKVQARCSHVFQRACWGKLSITCGVTSQHRERGGSGLHLAIGAAPRCCWDGTGSRVRSLVGYPCWRSWWYFVNLNTVSGPRYLESPSPRTGASVRHCGAAGLCGWSSSQHPSALPSSQNRPSSRHYWLGVVPSS